jgi:S-adenosylmethionine:tRNA ribosyltransferase-isomerase
MTKRLKQIGTRSNPMRVDLFDYDLPPERIALQPAEPREAARLLHVPASGPFQDLTVADLPSLIRSGDALVVNDTRVIPARLDGVRVRGAAAARIEATLIKRLDDNRWRALVRPAKKLNLGERVRFGEANESMACLLGALDATVEAKGEGGEIVFAFDFTGPALDEAIERCGQAPLPPYIAARRAPDASDRAAYQTMFAERSGAVAAPTAGLHFTPALLQRLRAAGASLHRVTLHVGAGTFLPVKSDDTGDHRMHSEWGRLDAETAAALNAARSLGGRIVAVGTTSLRLIESAADENGALREFEGETDIFITPGYRFRAVDALFTNFHLPRSTLLMLVAAFSGLERIRSAYSHAISCGYRFYSYGDAALLEREG